MSVVRSFLCGMAVHVPLLKEQLQYQRELQLSINGVINIKDNGNRCYDDTISQFLSSDFACHSFASFIDELG